MSWLYSRALVAEYSVENYSDGEQFAPLNVMLTPQRFWRNDKMMDCLKPSLFGLTLRHLTADHGEAVLMSFLAAFPVRTLAPLGGGAGIGGSRSGLWSEMARIIDEVRPQFVFVENSPLLVSRGLAVVVGDLAKMGYDAEWSIVSASNIGAPHKRDRIWIVAHANNIGRESSSRRALSRKQTEKGNDSRRFCKEMADTNDTRLQGYERERPTGTQREPNGYTSECGWKYGWPTEPELGRVANGVANRVDRLKAIGNGQVSRVAATAFNLLTEAQ